MARTKYISIAEWAKKWDINYSRAKDMARRGDMRKHVKIQLITTTRNVVSEDYEPPQR